MTDHFQKVKQAREKELWENIQKLQNDSQERLAQLNLSLTGRALERAQECFSNYEQLRKRFESINGRSDREYWANRSRKVAYSIVRLQMRFAKKVEQIFRVD